MDKKIKTALKASIFYMLAGSVWVLVTDKILGSIVDDKETLARISLIKGWTFVAVSGLIVFIIGYNALKKLIAAESELLKANTDISKAKDELATSYENLLIMKKKLHDMAYYDQLTGLRNKLSLEEDIAKIIENNKKFALFYMDLDNFKYVNDAFGHFFGNKLLKATTELLVGLMEENNSLYRLGGDKFIILLFDENGIFNIESFALSILKCFKNAIIVDDKTFYCTVSIGIALYPEHGKEMYDLLMCSEMALIKAKESGKNRIVIYSEPMKSSVLEWMDTEKYLRNALEKSEFELYFQPQLRIDTNEISGFEALIRWRNDEMGFIMPRKFLKVAEDTHMIIPIGEWVLRNACIFLKRLQQDGFYDKTVAVNVSKMQLMQDDFVECVMEYIEMAAIDPKNLEIEVSETILVESYDIVLEKLSALKMKGVGVAIDNFGKGYSALNYLHTIPVTTLKIDRIYADIISFGDNSRMLTDFLVKSGKSANLRIVGEGIETQEQFDYLKGLGCDRLQGYYVSRPLQEKEAIRMLRKPDDA